MYAVIIYGLQVSAISGILYGYYHFFLRNSRFHQYNRFYLLFIIVASFTIPFLRIPLYFQSADDIPVLYKTLAAITVYSNGTAAAPAAPRWHWQQLAGIVYAIVLLVLFARLFLSVLHVLRLRKKYTEEHHYGYTLLQTTEPGTPFSFFRLLFWNTEISLFSSQGQQVLRHELFHIRQKHSIDILLAELACVVCWINPFFHLLKKELKTIHEFLADRHASHSANKWDYAETLLMQTLRTSHSLVNPFFHNQIKRRIAMITNNQQTRYQYLKKIMVLPVFAITVGVIAVQCKSQDKKDVIADETNPPAGQLTIIPSKKENSTDSPGKKPETIEITEIPPTNNNASKPKPGVYEKVEIEAAYPGGYDAWKKFLQSNINADIPPDNGAPTGTYTTFIQFIVDKDGSISDIKSLTRHGYGMETEALRVIKLSGKWSPAIVNGQPVKAYRKQPITFQVTEQ